MSDIVSDWVNGLRVNVATTITPEMDLPLAGTLSGPPSPVVQFLKPRVQLLDGFGNVLAYEAPYGDPREVTPYVMVAIFGLVLLVVFLLGGLT